MWMVKMEHNLIALEMNILQKKKKKKIEYKNAI